MYNGTGELACVGAVLAVVILLGPAGCNEPEACPEGVALSGSDLPCACGDTTWDAIPPTEEGVVCTCDPEEGFSCDPPDCPTEASLTGEELPCLCAQERVDALPGDGSDCRCDPADGLLCAMDSSSGSGDGE